MLNQKRLPPLPPRRCRGRIASARAHLLALRTRRAHQERQNGEVPDRQLAGRRRRARAHQSLARRQGGPARQHFAEPLEPDGAPFWEASTTRLHFEGRGRG